MTSMSRRAVLLGGLAVPLLASCGHDDTAGGGSGGAADRAGLRLMTAKNVARAVPPHDTPVAATVDGIAAFGHDLVRTAAESTANFVVSPASIAYAFGMLRAGAKGASASQIDKVLGFPASGPHAALNALTRQVVTTDKAPPRARSKETRKQGEAPAPPVVALANGLFAQEGFAIRQAFLETIAENYGGGVRTLDLHQPAALQVINDWVRTQTAGRITKLFDQINRDIALVLANAVYLKADWATPFEESDTKDESFTKSDGSSVRTKMMSRVGTFPYAEGDGWQAAELPYAGGELAMWVLVPAKGGAAPPSLLAPDTMGAVSTGLRQGRARIVMPRWDFATKLDLLPALERLGMTVPFSDDADFSGIADNLAIGQAIHRATITVDEFGTEAAAVTGLGMRVTSLPAPPSVEIRADRAFAFAVMHKPTRTPLFVGQVTDPS
ncbi:MAG TPA: serpin family protein [Actinopolymorphaceae bacterium]|nr:serpin family protein [Actinopolymorphaceae bacterium]